MTKKKSASSSKTSSKTPEARRAAQRSDFGDEPEVIHGDAVAAHDQRQLRAEERLSASVVGGLPAAPRGPGHPPEPQPAASSVRPLIDESAALGVHGRLAARANRIAGLEETEAPRIKVMATLPGYYDHTRRRPGDVFTIDGTKLEEDVVTKDERTGKERVVRRKGEVAAFSKRWMKLVPKDTPEGITSSQEDLTRTIDDVKAARKRGGQAATTADARADREADGEVLGVE